MSLKKVSRFEEAQYNFSCEINTILLMVKNSAYGAEINKDFDRLYLLSKNYKGACLYRIGNRKKRKKKLIDAFNSFFLKKGNEKWKSLLRYLELPVHINTSSWKKYLK